MKLNQRLAVDGNINRILEMKASGIGNHTISGMFRDYGMDIPPEYVETISKVVPELAKEPLPKTEVKKLIKAHKSFNDKNHKIEQVYVPA